LGLLNYEGSVRVASLAGVDFIVREAKLVIPIRYKGYGKYAIVILKRLTVRVLMSAGY
jgi:hypothetical protein